MQRAIVGASVRKRSLAVVSKAAARVSSAKKKWLALAPAISELRVRRLRTDACLGSTAGSRIGEVPLNASGQDSRGQRHDTALSLRVSCKGMRIIDKKGIDTVLADIRTRGEQV